MVSGPLREFFVASAGVAGALVGLLFVAMTVAAERLARAERGGQLHRIRALAALTAFTNALVVSLLALVPGRVIGPTAVAVGGGGLMFITAALLSLIRVRQFSWRTLRDAVFMVGLIVTFALELVRGVQLISNPGNPSAANNLAILVAICFVLGIDRAWELVGGPWIGIGSEVVAMIRGHESAPDEPDREPDAD